jgi:chromosome segregation ATPase
LRQSAWDFPENPFKRVHDELEELQTQYYRLEHITKRASQALGSCGPGNILRELAKKADWKELDQAKKELDQVRTKNAHLHAQMAAMTQELSQKSEEIRKYHAEQTVVFSRIRELVGHPGEIVNKARLYD